MQLNLGCGRHAAPGMVNVDRVPMPSVDVVWNLDVLWPWPTGSVERIIARHVFEHVEDPVLFMTEAWRVLAPGGIFDIVVPWWQHSNSFTDPTHRRHCTDRTFDYWIAGTELNRDYGASMGDRAFECVAKLISVDEFAITLRR